ncbi:hypothetical protein Achl_2115 [Pseudarthrobacter chlorophenolicus A6]|uniref:Uncharacterized protein n=1 Tax=Pseudarthrobacter chlorophenolicus (strain ATCC 700700 / DSM 12829 / CIP 107037 / JCM 12360 / KCTC 9906 / NCIMB 13794 / A6) TaxID=452863 RepID=B8H9L4_PSECP|nr:hypothetical protein [Pseudarthrobacter chlorophenolicus]ACL40083.1 hypothetical protein Achl_2115 [Pseudarthrobacter chlorophenolicus A6]SDQ88140.1 hypothetical protein SAMN04489738_3384 [Pseudarthrobacter chlorophenolicus]
MKRREVWGVALLLAAAVITGGGLWLHAADGAAAGQGLLLYIGVRASNVVYGLMIVASLVAAAGLILVVPSLIGRIPRKVLRRTVGWTTGLAAAAALPFLGIVLIFAILGAVGIGDDVKVAAADGQSVLLVQDGFDGDAVDIYTPHDSLHYKWSRRADELGGWPRVKDQDCQLHSDATGLHLTCGAQTVTIDQ